MPDDAESLLPAGSTGDEAAAAAAGTAVTAAATTASHHHGPTHTHCQNCGAELQGPWCHRCGQHDFEFHRSFWHVFLEALETLFHFEGKFFRNIVTLLFRPGRLTLDFNAGKRAAQMPPFRLYVFVSFVFFLLIFLGGDAPEFIRQTTPSPTGLTVGGKSVTAEQLPAEVWREAVREMMPPDEREPADAPEKPAPAAETKSPEEVGRLLADGIKEVKSQQRAATLPAAQRQRNVEALGFFEQRARLLLEPEGRQRMSESFRHHLPHLLMACLPFFALYTRVLFRKSGQVYLQHLVLAVHFHTFIYLWLLCRNGWTDLAALPGWGLRAWVTLACDLWLGLYPLLMLRRVFANSWLKTLLKSLLLTLAYGLTLGLGFFVTAVLIFVYG